MTLAKKTVDLTFHFKNMALAAFVAFRALQNGETPVACIFVHEASQRILSYGCNDTNRSLNGTRHAEFLGIDEILAQNDLLGASRDKIAAFFAQVSLYVTIEPCVMCASALQHVGIGKVYFGAANDRFGGNGTVLRAHGDSYLSIGGILRPEAISLLRNFYVQENETAPVPKIKKNKDIEDKEYPENLNFAAYLSKDIFTEELGFERVSTFFDVPNLQLELTPVLGSGYEIDQLLSVNDVQRIPKYQNLYPGKNQEWKSGLDSELDEDIRNDIATMETLFPRISKSGSIRMDHDLDVKKRKLEASEGQE